GIVPARREGEAIVPGDIITALDGKPVGGLAELAARLDDRAVGETVELTLQRGTAKRKLRLTLAPGG
ncbi:MAG: PDZ domain-containing protein, partial [Erythrobacter cryptus]